MPRHKVSPSSSTGYSQRVGREAIVLTETNLASIACLIVRSISAWRLSSDVSNSNCMKVLSRT